MVRTWNMASVRNTLPFWLYDSDVVIEDPLVITVASVYGYMKKPMKTMWVWPNLWQFKTDKHS